MTLKSLKVDLLKKSGSMVAWVMLLVVALLVPQTVGAQARPLLRISVENHPGHVQTEAVRTFAERLKSEFDDRFTVEFYDSADLFRDRDVVAALADGKVEIAVPGTWQLDRFEPSVALFLLPTFFGRSAEFVHAMSDGPIGDAVAARIEAALPVQVLGRWLDLGPANLYLTDQTIRSHSDVRGLSIRVAGGVANELRIAELGARSITIAWADLPAQLRSGSVDGTLTTHETVRSGSLWEHGITAAIEDHEYFPQYVPLIRASFWRRLSESDRRSIERIWDGIVDEQRAAAAVAQRSARVELERNGIVIREPSPTELERVRLQLLEQERAIADRLGIGDDLYDLLLSEIR